MSISQARRLPSAGVYHQPAHSDSDDEAQGADVFARAGNDSGNSHPVDSTVRFHFSRPAPARQAFDAASNGAGPVAATTETSTLATSRSVTVLSSTSAPAATAAAALAVASQAVAEVQPMPLAEFRAMAPGQTGPSRTEMAVGCTLASTAIGAASGALCGGIMGVTLGGSFFAGTVGLWYCVLRYADHVNPPDQGQGQGPQGR